MSGGDRAHDRDLAAQAQGRRDLRQRRTMARALKPQQRERRRLARQTRAAAYRSDQDIGQGYGDKEICAAPLHAGEADRRFRDTGRVLAGGDVEGCEAIGVVALRAELRARGVFDAATQPKLDPLLTLVALGTVADVVKLDANNRRLVAQGLKRIRAGQMPAGIAALFHAAGRKAPVATTFDFGFALGP
eukprot:gene1938-2548_t